MNELLEKIHFSDFVLESNKKISFPLYYQTFGQPIGLAPIVLVNHALTGNSQVIGKNGWWNDLMGSQKTIDTDFFTIIAFNIPGNGFDGNPENLIHNPQDLTIRDVARIFWEALSLLNIHDLFMVIGGSLGGAVAWEMAVQQPSKIQNLVPIATDWKATDWVIANVLLQEKILNHSPNPIADARLHAMLLYRTPQSLNLRFQRQKKNDFEIINWLNHHGSKLKNRFKLSAYQLMNHLLKTHDVTRDRDDFSLVAAQIKSHIFIISIDTDCFFVAEESRETYQSLKKIKENVFYHEIKSIHGHDAFLMENKQLSFILNTILKPLKKTNHVNA